MSILILYPFHKDDVFYLCCKLENTNQTHGSVRSPELIGRNSIVIIVQGLYISIMSFKNNSFEMHLLEDQPNI